MQMIMFLLLIFSCILSFVAGAPRLAAVPPILVEVVAKREFLLGAEGPQTAIFGLDVITREIKKIPITLNANPVALSFDPTTDKVYWSDNINHLIRTADLNGSMAETVTGSTGTSTIDGMAVDYINRLLYYTDTGPDTINVLSLDNYDYRLTLIDTGLDEPRAIALLPNDGMMFWTDWGVDSKIEMADMDGSNRHLFLSLPNGTWPNGLAIDTKAKTVYWADAKLHRIESITMDKSSRTVIYQSLRAHYFSIVLMGNRLYYNDWTKQYISRMTKAGELLEQFGPSVLQRSYGMYAYNYSEITQGSSVCEISDCQQLCLPKQLGQHTCGCKNGYSLSSDKISCQIDNSKIIIKPLTVPHNVTEGRQLEIQCEFNTTSSTPSSGYTWRKNGIRIPGQSSSIYRLQRVQRSDDGNYTCAVDIDGSTMTATIILNVLYPPNVTVPLEMKVIESTTLSITCTAVANPSILSFKWTGPNGQDLTKYDFQATTHTTLTMPYIDRTKSGEYSCTASNTMIESPAPTHPITARLSKITIVHILYGPSTETSQETINVTMQSDLKLTCSVDSNPEPSNYQWYNPDGSYAAVTRYLDLSNISKNQGGDYKCETMTKLVPTNGDPITKMHSKIFHVNVLSSLGHGEQGVRGQPKINTTNMKTVGLGVGISAAIIVIIVVVVIAAVCYRKRHVRGQNRELNRFHNASDARPFAGMEVSTIAGQSSESPYAVLYDNRQDGNTAREISVIETPTSGSEEEHPYDTVTWMEPRVSGQVDLMS
ncbi:uncharacterized protein LOC126832503 isoform X2 [Patella vulgata]|uniref:uncharacterized protein LOC126832503 isoform X2 n=1 Tax=Patella vulgata TaxID=6465 RepID=UPI0024A84282|nr:uncharacterized protein LOC126832503 isoform X2 [Patella vulgata]